MCPSIAAKNRHFKVHNMPPAQPEQEDQEEEQVVAEADDAIIHKNIFEIISLNPFEVEDQ